MAASSSPVVSSTATPHGAIVRARRLDPPSRAFVVAALRNGEAGGVEAGDERVERGVVSGVEADEGGVVGRAGSTIDALRLVVVAPGHRSRRGSASPGTRPMTSPKNEVSDDGSGTSRPR